MRKSFLPAAMAVAVAVGFTTPAAAQEPTGRFVVVNRCPPKFEVVNRIPAACGCPLADCTCGAVCPCALAATPKAAPTVCTDAGCFPAGSASAFAPTYAAGSACAGGNCAAPASYRFQPFGGRFRR